VSIAPTACVDSSTIVVTGGDSVYFPLIEELHRSILAVGPKTLPAFGVIDAGLTADQSSRLAQAGVRVVRPACLPKAAQQTFGRRPALAANVGKLWLDELFPGFATLIWLDADTWVQDFAAVDLLHGAAQTGALAIVSDSGRYWERQIEVRWLLGGVGGLCQMRSFFFKNGRHTSLPRQVLRDLANRGLLNAGAFALRSVAPHWRALRAWQAKILGDGGKIFTSDQLAMGLAVYIDRLPVELMPTSCNYIRPFRVNLRVPTIVEFFYPYRPVGIVHLAGQKTIRFDPEATTDVPDLEGRMCALNLRFGHFHRMASALTAPEHAHRETGATCLRAGA
jgi:hypothetical protein